MNCLIIFYIFLAIIVEHLEFVLLECSVNLEVIISQQDPFTVLLLRLQHSNSLFVLKQTQKALCFCLEF